MQVKKRIINQLRPPVYSHVRSQQPLFLFLKANLERYFPITVAPRRLVLSQNTLSPTSQKYRCFYRSTSKKFDSCLRFFICLPTKSFF